LILSISQASIVNSAAACNKIKRYSEIAEKLAELCTSHSERFFKYAPTDDEYIRLDAAWNELRSRTGDLRVSKVGHDMLTEAEGSPGHELKKKAKLEGCILGSQTDITAKGRQEPVWIELSTALGSSGG